MKNRFDKFCVSFLLCAACLTVGCANKPSPEFAGAIATLAVASALRPMEELIVWSRNKDGAPASHWIRGNGVMLDIIATRPDIVIPEGPALWQFDTFIEPDGGTIAELVELVTGERIALFETNSAAEDTPCPTLVRRLDVEPIASVGPYIFVQYREEIQHCDDRTFSQIKHLVFDIVEKIPADVLKPEELSQLMETKEVKGGAGGDDFTLFGLSPQYNIESNLSLTYIFATEGPVSEIGGAKVAYAQSLEIPARAIPEALIPFAVGPHPVHSFGLLAPTRRLGGWRHVVGSLEEVEAVFVAFDTQ